MELPTAEEWLTDQIGGDESFYSMLYEVQVNADNFLTHYGAEEGQAPDDPRLPPTLADALRVVANTTVYVRPRED